MSQKRIDDINYHINYDTRTFGFRLPKDGWEYHKNYEIKCEEWERVITYCNDQGEIEKYDCFNECNVFDSNGHLIDHSGMKVDVQDISKEMLELSKKIQKKERLYFLLGVEGENEY